MHKESIKYKPGGAAILKTPENHLLQELGNSLNNESDIMSGSSRGQKFKTAILHVLGIAGTSLYTYICHTMIIAVLQMERSIAFNPYLACGHTAHPYV